MVAPKFMVTDLNRIFQYKVLKMLKKAGKIWDIRNHDPPEAKQFPFFTTAYQL